MSPYMKKSKKRQKKTMTLAEVYEYGTARLDEAGIEYPSVDAFYLLEYAAKIDKTKYLMFKDQEVTDKNFEQYKALIDRRATHIPYQYITGTAEFMGLVFEVNPDVLIPRLDTEVMGQEALKCIGFEADVLDLCTGSGCIGISLKRYRPDIHVTCSDISHKALNVARRNVAHQHLELANETGNMQMGIRLAEGDLFEPFEDDEKFDLIISNPPYVSESEYRDLMPEVKDHEPILALIAGPKGLDIYTRLIPEAPKHLKDGGILMLETGSGQAKDVAELMQEAGFKEIEVIKDLAELDRVVKGKICLTD